MINLILKGKIRQVFRHFSKVITRFNRMLIILFSVICVNVILK